MDTAKTILELLFYCSGVAVAILAAIGLRQLTLAKENVDAVTAIARTTSKREAFKLAAEQCAHYYNHIVPLLNEYDKWIEKKVLSDVVAGWEIEISGDRIKIKPKSSKIRERFLTEISATNLPALNALEGLAVLFTSGVASEEVAFSSIGYTFCFNVRRSLPTILLIGDGTHFLHILSLFMLWQRRIERQELDAHQKQTDERLRELQDDGIKPIGM